MFLRNTIDHYEDEADNTEEADHHADIKIQVIIKSRLSHSGVEEDQGDDYQILCDTLSSASSLISLLLLDISAAEEADKALTRLLDTLDTETDWSWRP